MRDRSRELNMLRETLQILEQGYYEKNGKKVSLKLSRSEMEEIHVYLPDRALKDLSYNGHTLKDLFYWIDFAVLDRTQEQYNFRQFHRKFAYDNFYSE